MTPDERVQTCRWLAFELDAEISAPWYSPSTRLRQQNQNFISSSFTRGVAAARRIGGSQKAIADAVEPELMAWDPEGIVN
jgi:hypothetical protein